MLGAVFLDTFWVKLHPHPLTFFLQEALQIANDMYQEVHSKDGISRHIADKVELKQQEA